MLHLCLRNAALPKRLNGNMQAACLACRYVLCGISWHARRLPLPMPSSALLSWMLSSGALPCAAVAAAGRAADQARLHGA